MQYHTGTYAGVNYRELTAPQLVGRWKAIVNDRVMIGRDSHLMKDFLLKATSVQILLGMYRQESKTITIPQFLRQSEDWLEEDDLWAEIELARYITHITPPEYYTYWDWCEEETAYAFNKSLEARLKLREWSEKILA